MRALRAAAVAGLTVLSTAGATSTASADNPTYPVMNTSETPPDGVWFRNSASSADTERVTGLGVYAGESVLLVCYAWGETVGPHDNNLWYLVKNISRPAVGSRENSGFLNAHYVNDGTVANQIAPGVSQCGTSGGPDSTTPAESAPSSVASATSEGPTTHSEPPISVFFSGTENPGGVYGVGPADLNLKQSDWAAGNCDSAQAFPAATSLGSNIRTLSGWSKGRLGVIYFLQSAPRSAIEEIDRIVLFDPGRTDQFAKPSAWASLLGAQTCDWRFDTNGIISSWLSSDESNRLIVLTGRASEEKDSSGQPTFAGLWKYYFAGLWNQPFADQSIVCDYDEMEHDDVLINFASIVESGNFSCPRGIGSWHP